MVELKSYLFTYFKPFKDLVASGDPRSTFLPPAEWPSLLQPVLFTFWGSPFNMGRKAPKPGSEMALNDTLAQTQWGQLQYHLGKKCGRETPPRAEIWVHLTVLFPWKAKWPDPFLGSGDCFDLEVIRLESKWQVDLGEKNVDHCSECPWRWCHPHQTLTVGCF